jgi:hypothetical protein
MRLLLCGFTSILCFSLFETIDRINGGIGVILVIFGVLCLIPTIVDFVNILGVDDRKFKC